MTEHDPAITHLATFRCPHCDYLTDAAGTVDGQAGAPAEGDACACINCGCPTVFHRDPVTGLLMLSPMTCAEADALTAQQREDLARVQFFARQVLPHERVRRH